MGLSRADDHATVNLAGSLHVETVKGLRVLSRWSDVDGQPDGACEPELNPVLFRLDPER